VKLPPLNDYEGGQQLATLAQDHALTFFEFWYSDFLGHKMEQAQSLQILHRLNYFLEGILAGLDPETSLLLVVSDHGNFEDWTTKKHTENPALTLLAGREAGDLAPKLQSLQDVKPAVLAYLLNQAR
jgi:bisphosphoglycerate-independent phosphoglycerate mutase (AlkP superfamily)